MSQSKSIEEAINMGLSLGYAILLMINNNDEKRVIWALLNELIWKNRTIRYNKFNNLKE